eukprot:gene2163-8023_t
MTASAAAIVIIVVFLVLVALVGMHFMCRKTKNVPWGKNAGALSASTDCERDSTVVIPSAEDKNADALPTNTSSSETDNVRNLMPHETSEANRLSAMFIENPLRPQLSQRSFRLMGDSLDTTI